MPSMMGVATDLVRLSVKLARLVPVPLDVTAQLAPCPVIIIHMYVVHIMSHTNSGDTNQHASS